MRPVVKNEAVIGMLMLDTKFKRLPGDIGHPDTFAFPVRRLVVRNATSADIVVDQDESFLSSFIESAQLLEREGARGIATSCGFLSRWQRELSSSVGIPVATSSLLLLPLAAHLAGDGKTVGVLTARASSLSQSCFESCFAADVPVDVVGMEGTSFYRTYVDNSGEPDAALFERELLAQSYLIKERNSDLGAMVLECTNMPPFAKGLSAKLGVPVLNANDLVSLLYASID